MPRLVQWSRFSDAFQRLFGIQGATQLSVVDDVFMTLPVEQELLHLANLRGWRPWWYSRTVAAIAANYGSIRLGAALNALVVLEGFSVDCAAGANVIQGAPLGGAFGFPVRDARQYGTGGIIGGPTIASAANVARIVSTPAFVAPVTGAGLPPSPFNIQHVITTAADLIFEANAVNTAITVNMWGMVRELTAQENGG